MRSGISRASEGGGGSTGIAAGRIGESMVAPDSSE